MSFETEQQMRSVKCVCMLIQILEKILENFIISVPEMPELTAKEIKSHQK